LIIFASTPIVVFMLELKVASFFGLRDILH
jgi:hypothetical protein